MNRLQQTRFKKGDRLAIKKHTEEEKKKYPNGWNKNMDQNENTTVIIKKALGSYGSSGDAYTIQNDNSKRDYVWDYSSFIHEYKTF